MKVKFSAPTVVFDKGNAPVFDATRLKALDDVASDECFSDYLIDGSSTKDLADRGVTGGYLRLRFRRDLGEVWTETEYNLGEPLTDTEIQILKKYTLGQWSDGIGENFPLDCADQTGLFVSLPEDAGIELS